MGTKDSFVEFTFHREVQKKKASVCHACTWPRQYLFLELGWQFELKHRVITGPNFTLNTNVVTKLLGSVVLFEVFRHSPCVNPFVSFFFTFYATFFFFFKLNFASFSILPTHSVFYCAFLVFLPLARFPWHKMWHLALGSKIQLFLFHSCGAGIHLNAILVRFTGYLAATYWVDSSRRGGN